MDFTILNALPAVIKAAGLAVRNVLGMFGAQYLQLILIVVSLLCGWLLSRGYAPSKWGVALLYAGIIYCIVALA